jgi:hypothetical protein
MKVVFRLRTTRSGLVTSLRSRQLILNAFAACVTLYLAVGKWYSVHWALTGMYSLNMM